MKDILESWGLISNAFDPHFGLLVGYVLLACFAARRLIAMVDFTLEKLDVNIKRLAQPHMQRLINDAVCCAKSCIRKLNAMPVITGTASLNVQFMGWFLIAAICFEVAVFYIWSASIVVLSVIQGIALHTMSGSAAISVAALLITARLLYKLGAYFRRYAHNLRLALTLPA